MVDFAKLVFNLSSTQVVVGDAAIKTAYTVLVLSGYTFSPFFTGMWDIYRGLTRFIIPIARFRSYMNQNLNYRDIMYREMGNYMFNHVIDMNIVNRINQNLPNVLNRNIPLLRAPGGIQLPQIPIMQHLPQLNNVLNYFGRNVFRGMNRAGEVFQDEFVEFPQDLNIHRPFQNGFQNVVRNSFRHMLDAIRQRWPGH